MYSDKLSSHILTALLVGHGLREAVVCPGSRNAALVHDFSTCPDLRCIPATDERSAGFLALGLAQQVGRPVAVCVTSGSALLGVLPAAAEATYRHCGIVVISADRPSAWIGQLDGQTMPQVGALGSFVAKSVSLPEVSDSESHWHCNRLVNEALLCALRPDRPSVHINVPLSEPLFSFTTPQLPAERIVRPVDFRSPEQGADFLAHLAAARLPLYAVGQTDGTLFSRTDIRLLNRHGLLLYDCISLDSGEPALTDELLAALPPEPEYQPDFVVWFGGHTVSKRLRQYLRSLPASVPVAMVSASDELHDVSQHAQYLLLGGERFVKEKIIKHLESRELSADCEKLSADCGKLAADCEKPAADCGKPAADCEKQAYPASLWQALRREVAAKVAATPLQFGAELAVRLFEQDFDSATEVACYANSTAVRLANRYARHFCHCNRGLNGIEGSISTAVGVALGASLLPPKEGCPHKAQSLPDTSLKKDGEGLEEDGTKSLVFCVTGDLSFFYDGNALWNNAPCNLRILLLNDQGGSIFRTLPRLAESPVADTLVSGRHDRTAEHFCRHHGLAYLRATDEATLRQGITALRRQDTTSPILLEVLCPSK